MSDTSHWKTYLKRSFPHITLVVIYISYLIAGGVIFHGIEQDHATNVLNATITGGTWEEISALLSSCSENIDLQDQDQLEVLLGSLIRQLVEERAEVVDPGNQWTISSSVLFCMTTITTIGYGTITPVTAAGKLIAILYSLIGIPLSVIFVADMGGLLAQLASNMTSRTRRRCRRMHRPNRRFEPFVNETENENTRPINLHELSSEEEEEEFSGSGGGYGGTTSRGNGQVSRRIVISSERPSYLANFAESPHDSDGTVPIVIVVCLLFCYICFGAIIFSISEGWPFLDALYFTFVTLATIGYGDLYPVEHIDRNTMLPVTMYTLFGLCWVSMCVWLIVGKVWRLVKTIETKLLSCVGMKEVNKK